MNVRERDTMVVKKESNNSALLKNYQKSIDAGEITGDVYQAGVITELQKIYNNLVKQSVTVKSKHRRFSNLSYLFKRRSADPVTHQGLYLWGGVGRGKTYLVDFFYKHLPIKRKLRLHFHRFMQIVHEELNQLASTADPLEIVANSNHCGSRCYIK